MVIPSGRLVPEVHFKARRAKAAKSLRLFASAGTKVFDGFDLICPFGNAVLERKSDLSQSS